MWFVVWACVGACMHVLGESRCSGADSSTLCILKSPLPPAAKIGLEVEGEVHGWWWREGCRREEREGVT